MLSEWLVVVVVVVVDLLAFHNPLAGFSLLILEVSKSHTMTQNCR
jgi:hypothetical protein